MRKLDFILHLVLIFALLLLLLIMQKEGLIFVMIAQFFVGIYQVASSLIRSIRFPSFDPTIKKLIVWYWIACIGYFIGMMGLYFINADHDYISYYYFIAWGIAFYYCYITYLLAYPKYAKSHLDI